MKASFLKLKIGYCLSIKEEEANQTVLNEKKPHKIRDVFTLIMIFDQDKGCGHGSSDNLFPYKEKDLPMLYKEQSDAE